MADPVYSLITDLNGNGPCMAPYPYENTRLVAMITPCPFEDKDFVPGSAASTNNSDLSYGNGFIKATTTSTYKAYAQIVFRLKHNGGNRIIRVTKSANSQDIVASYWLLVNNISRYSVFGLTLGDNILVPPYYRYQLSIFMQASQPSIYTDFEEIWIKVEIL